MKWLEFCKKFFGPPVQEDPATPAELEHHLDTLIEQGDYWGVRNTLTKLGRGLLETERVVLIGRCIEKRKFDYAFNLIRDLSSDVERKSLLEILVREAAAANNLNAVRAAELIAEQIDV